MVIECNTDSNGNNGYTDTTNYDTNRNNNTINNHDTHDNNTTTNNNNTTHTTTTTTTTNNNDNKVIYLHGASPPIVHSDLKPSNVMVQQPWISYYSMLYYDILSYVT